MCAWPDSEDWNDGGCRTVAGKLGAPDAGGVIAQPPFMYLGFSWWRQR